MPSPIGSSNSINLNMYNQRLTSREEVVKNGQYNDGDKQIGANSRIKDQTKFSEGVGMVDHDDNIMMTQWGKDNAVKEINGALANQKGEVFLEVVTGEGANDVGIIKFDMRNPADVEKLKNIAKLISDAPSFHHLELKQGFVTNKEGQESSQISKEGNTYQPNTASLFVATE